MAAWIEDAQILAAQTELSNARDSILHVTRDVDAFLAPANRHSSALVAPKGFGKTLVLKLKRVLFRDDSTKVLPKDVIVDRPKDRPPILANEIIALLEESATWETIWQIGIAVAVLKGYRDDPEARRHLVAIENQFASIPAVNNIINNPYVESPFEVVHSIISASRASLFAIVSNSAVVTAAFARFTRPTAIFIDNIDEYLEHYISNRMYERSTFSRQYIDLWHNGQVGALLALRRLNGINPHVKIFLSIRKEAFQYAAKNEASFANLRAFTQELRYTREDIQKIIQNNILAEPKSNLSEARRLDGRNSDRPENAVEAFLGTRSLYVSNVGTGVEEPTLQYWLRHCTLRPRDAVAIGSELSKLRPEDRNRETIRSVINMVAADRVQTIFSEVAPFFDDLVPTIIPKVVESNVMSREALRSAAEAYTVRFSDEFGSVGDEILHPFSALYAMGLLGVVLEDRDRPGRLVQQFAPLGAAPFGDNSILPVANTYLLHPAMSDYVASRNVTFLHQINRHNVIGDGLDWRHQEQLRFVAVGDIAAYRRKVMANVGAASTFEAFWASVIAEHTRDLDLASTSAGDTIVLVDRSAVRMLTAARSIAIAVRNSGYGLDMRFGAHCGHWQIAFDADGVAQPNISPLMGTAARLEAHAAAGVILMSAQVVDIGDLQSEPHLYLGVHPIRPEEVADPTKLDGTWLDIAKPGEDPELVDVFAMTLAG